MYLASVNGSNYFGWIVFGGIALLGLSAIPATIAHGKGCSWFGFYVFSLIAFPFALATALLLPPIGYYDDIHNISIRIKKMSDNQEAAAKTAKEKERLEAEKREKAEFEKWINENKEQIACNHEDRQRTTYLIYKGNELFAKRELCKECVERIKQYGLFVFRA